MINDPFELENLASQEDYTQPLKDLRQRLEHMRLKTKDFLPERRTPDDFDRMTGLPTEARVRPRPSKAEMLQNLK